MRILWGKGAVAVRQHLWQFLHCFLLGGVGFLSPSGGICSALDVRSECFEGIWWLLARVSLQFFAVWSGVCPVVSMEGSLSLCISISS